MWHGGRTLQLGFTPQSQTVPWGVLQKNNELVSVALARGGVEPQHVLGLSGGWPHSAPHDKPSDRCCDNIGISKSGALLWDF